MEQLARLVRGAVLEAEPHLARIRVSAIHGLRSDRLWDYSQNIATTTHWQIDAYEVDASGAHVTRSWRGVVSQSELFAAIAMTGVLKQVEPSNAWINMR